ncbi:MAG: ABC transporter ATP-binding protein [Ruminococcaceae bacterium]|nr:ABC transporter ATP-binding protein [Oscillospiraceae bacterium]
MIMQMSNVSKIYKGKFGEIKALDSVDFCLEEGEYCAVTGRSGSGKSTLMNIAGLLDSPTDGEYFFCGKPVGDMTSRELTAIRSRSIGFVFQSFNLISNLTALENVELPLIYRGMKKNERRKLAVRALESVGLYDRLTHKPGEMSGGQRQRVAIARAVASQPKLILADEPTGNLDPKASGEVAQLLRALTESGCSVLLITHDENLARQADRRVSIESGTIK